MAEINTSANAADPVQFVADPKEDIAVNDIGERMCVNIKDRQLFQHMYIRGGLTRGKVSTIPYRPEEDAPNGWKPVLVPSPNELSPDSQRVEVLVVGLLLLNDPLRYSNRGKGQKSEAKQKERKNRGIITRPDRVARVAVPVTPKIAATVVYVALVNPIYDVHGARKIDAKAIFFFEEFHPKIWRPLVLRAGDLSAMCKEAAAIDKQPSRPINAQLDDVGSSQFQTAKPLKAKQHSTIFILLDLQYSFWKYSKEPGFVTLMEQYLEDLVPELDHMPKSGIGGLDSFYNGKVVFDIKKCQQMLAELSAHYEDFAEFEPEKVIKIRNELHSLKRLDELSRRDFPAFLHAMYQAFDEGEDDDNDLKVYMRGVLSGIKQKNGCRSWRPSGEVKTIGG